MSFREKWSSPANKAALLAIPVALFVVFMLATIAHSFEGSMSFGFAVVAFLIAWAFATGAIMKRRTN